jgi:hypothetical protein
MAEAAGRGLLPGAAMAGAALALVAVPGRAAAETLSTEVLLSQSTMVINQQSNVYDLTAPGPGTLSVQLEDVAWPNPLSSLTFSLDSASSVLGWVASDGELSLSIARGGSYYVDVSGQAGGALDLGLYSLQVDFCPQNEVPLPAALGLMLCGLGILGGARLAWMRNESFMYAV